MDMVRWLVLTLGPLFVATASEPGVKFTGYGTQLEEANSPPGKRPSKACGKRLPAATHRWQHGNQHWPTLKGC